MSREPYRPTPAPDLPIRPHRDALVKAVVVELLHELDGRRVGAPAAILKARNWGKDVETISKAIVAPASTQTTGWAAELVGESVSEFVRSLSPMSAAAALFSKGLQLRFDPGVGQVTVPSLTASALPFVGEGSAIPLVKYDSSTGAILTPKDIKAIVHFSRQTLESSNIEALTRVALTESVGLTLDAVSLDNNPATAVRPAGLRFGIAGLTATAGGGDAAVFGDLQQLLAAVSVVAGNQPIILVASPKQAVRLRLLSHQPRDPVIGVLASSALAPGLVIAIAVNALCSAIDPKVQIDVSTETSFVERDDPPAWSTQGTPNVIAAPTRSLWQTDSIALKATFGASWALRSSSGLAWTSSTTW